MKLGKIIPVIFLVLGLLVGCGDVKTEKVNSEESEMKINITVGESTFEATLSDTSASRELYELLGEGPMELSLDDYGGFEKVGSFGRSFTTEDTHITAKPGDMMLYQGDKLVLFYGENSWSYTRLGKVDSTENWREELGNGIVTVTLERP